MAAAHRCRKSICFACDVFATNRIAAWKLRNAWNALYDAFDDIEPHA